MTDHRLIACLARVRAGHSTGAHPTWGDLVDELVRRLSEGDDEGRLPGEPGYVEPSPMVPL